MKRFLDSDDDEEYNHNGMDFLFQKKFRYKQKRKRPWELPPPTELFSEYYKLPELQILKEQLNDVKSKLNDYPIEEWSAHTRARDPANGIPKKLRTFTCAEFVTVAWCKFFECLRSYPLVRGPQLNSLHLCEAPGAFIAALNHHLYNTFPQQEVKWKWLATTLNPYYEGNPLSKMIIDDRLMLYTLDHWLFFEDFTGNIMNPNNIDQLKQQCDERFNDGRVDLVTADGSVDCLDTPESQEEFVGRLHFTELTAALIILADGGSFVLKMFTLFDATSVCVIFFLNCVFRQVHIFKPATSKRGNSEVYVICFGYKKQTKYLSEALELMKSKVAEPSNTDILPLFAQYYLPAKFLQQHEICVKKFMDLQIEAIESNIFTFQKTERREERVRRFCISAMASANFYERYKVNPIPPRNMVLNESIYDQQSRNYKNRLCRGSYTERQMLKGGSKEEEKLILRSQLREVRNPWSLESFLDWENSTPSDAKEPVLSMHNGMPFNTLHSSLYASVETLSMRQKLQKLFEVDPIWADEPKFSFDHSYETMLDYSFSTDFSEIQQKFFVAVLSEIIGKEPRLLIFTNFPFLTHLSVSVLLYLSQSICDKITISSRPKFTISLKDCKYGLIKIDGLKKIRDALQSDKTVMSIMNTVDLHRTEFCTALTDFNNRLLFKNFRELLK